MRFRAIQLLAISSLVAGFFALVSGPAVAGPWHIYSCGATPSGVNPSDEGWSTSDHAYGGESFSKIPSPNCAAGFPEAYLSGLVPEEAGAYEAINFSSPTGSLITGGSLSFAASATSPNNTAVGVVSVANAKNNPFWECAGYFGQANACPAAPSLSADEQVTIPNQQSSELSMTAKCGGAALNGDKCTGSGSVASPVADARLFAADIELTTGAVPVIGSVSGSATKEAVNKITNIDVHASEPSGPGIYEIYMTADGSPAKLAAMSGSEDSPTCVNYGPTKGEAWGFVSTQPCDLNFTASFNLNTAVLSNGAHTLYFTAVDGAGGVATQALPITIDNPVPPPPPACVVPKVKAGSTVTSIEHSLTAHHCGVGTKVKKASRRVRKGRVISLNGHAGAHLPNGTAIVINVSSGRPHRHRH